MSASQDEQRYKDNFSLKMYKPLYPLFVLHLILLQLRQDLLTLCARRLEITNHIEST